MKPNVVMLPASKGHQEELSDEAILAACGAGDTAALGLLFDRFHADVWRFLSRVMEPSCPELDDIAQATFLEAWRSAKKFRGRSAVKSWIFGIAYNLARHYFRGQTRKQAAMNALVHIRKEERGLFEHAADRQQIERLARALARLSEDKRVAFVLVDVEGLRGVDAAEALGVRPGTLWRRLHEARKALREALKEEA